MASPDYSILIVEYADQVSGLTQRVSYLFTYVEDARLAYEAEVTNPDKRVFLFEKPQPTRFHRNDKVSLRPYDNGEPFLNQWS